MMAHILEEMMSSDPFGDLFSDPFNLPDTPETTIIHVEVKQLRPPSPRNDIAIQNEDSLLHWFALSQPIEMRVVVYLGLVIVAILLYYLIRVY